MNKHFSMTMGRILLAVFVCLFGLNNLCAQTAVLAHEGELSMFYGSDSFIAAYNAAVDEDVITLSEGTFNSPSSIDKSITIHGAGAREDAVAGNLMTRIISSMTVGSNPIIEGISFGTVYLGDQSSPQFVKCNISKVEPTHEEYKHCQTVSFTDCYILALYFRYYGNGRPSYIDNCQMVNSVVWDLYESVYGQDNVASNSVIRVRGMGNFTTYNSIIIRYLGNPSNTCTFYNCIGIKNGNEGQVFENSLNSTVVEYDNITDVFPAFVGEDIFNEPFILDEGIAASFLGNNGTEVGIHGGYYPYSNRPGYMKVRHCTVGDRTTDVGHLSVDIEVVTEE